MPKPKKPKVKVLYSINLSGKEVDGPCDLTFYDIIQDNKYFVVRYYGVCAVESCKSLEDAKNYVRAKSAYLIARAQAV